MDLRQMMFPITYRTLDGLEVHDEVPGAMEGGAPPTRITRPAFGPPSGIPDNPAMAETQRVYSFSHSQGGRRVYQEDSGQFTQEALHYQDPGQVLRDNLHVEISSGESDARHGTYIRFETVVRGQRCILELELCRVGTMGNPTRISPQDFGWLCDQFKLLGCPPNKFGRIVFGRREGT